MCRVFIQYSRTCNVSLHFNFVGLAPVPGVTVEGQNETSITFNVTAGLGNWDYYNVTCESWTAWSWAWSICVPPVFCQCVDLTPGANYYISVITSREGFQDRWAYGVEDTITGKSMN